MNISGNPSQVNSLFEVAVVSFVHERVKKIVSADVLKEYNEISGEVPQQIEIRIPSARAQLDELRPLLKAEFRIGATW